VLQAQINRTKLIELQLCKAKGKTMKKLSLTLILIITSILNLSAGGTSTPCDSKEVQGTDRIVNIKSIRTSGASYLFKKDVFLIETVSCGTKATLTLVERDFISSLEVDSITEINDRFESKSSLLFRSNRAGDWKSKELKTFFRKNNKKRLTLIVKGFDGSFFTRDLSLQL
jgi:hypothetical protein